MLSFAIEARIEIIDTDHYYDANNNSPNWEVTLNIAHLKFMILIELFH